MSVVKKSSLSNISMTELQSQETISMPEIRIQKGSDCALYVSTSQLKMQHIHSITISSRPDLFFKEEINGDENLQENEYIKEEESIRVDGNGKEVTFKKRNYSSVEAFIRSNSWRKNKLVEN